MLRSFCVALFSAWLVLWLASPAAAQDWPRWRGPDGVGVASSSPLPVELGADSKQLLWKIEVPGEGISSPIVQGERVFLTTAYPGEVGAQMRTLKLVGVSALLGLAALIALLALRARGGSAAAKGLAGWRRLFVRADALFVALASLGFTALAVVATFQPDLLWADGVKGDIWVASAMLSLVGGFAGFGWSRASSPLRVLGALLLLAAATYLFLQVPNNKYNAPFSRVVRLAMVAPGVAGAGWFVLLYAVLGRSAAATSNARRPHAIGGLSLATAAALLFLSYNFWLPSAGLVRAALCFDLETGEKRWETALFVAPEERKYGVNSYATPTPCTDGELLFANFGGGVACLDLNGELLWLQRDEEYTGASRYGASTSPVLYEDTVILMQDGESSLRPSYGMALEKRTGKQRWRVQPSDAMDAYLTPLLWRRGERDELVTLTTGHVLGYDPRSGERLWTIPLDIFQMVPSLCSLGDLLLLSGGTHSQRMTAALRLRGTGKETQGEVAWQTKRAAAQICSPVLVNGCFFTLSDTGILTCFEPEKGTSQKTERLEGPHWASLVAGDGKLYAVSEQGRIDVVGAGPALERLGGGELGEECYATPAIAHGRLLIRGKRHLFCFGAKR
ncbi:MAG: PQQ-binding-like beta-propeller repeat protein [Planctomycetes bacterium]|nr:PQQ-binding-like beta-propeller repeat protein [Planctomycetota bacterium]